MDNDRIIVLFSLKKIVEALLDSKATQNFMSMKYAKQYNIPLIKKTTPRTFGSIKPGEKFRIKYETEPLWVASHTHREQLVFDVFEKWKPIYFGIPWFRKWNPKIDWRSMQVTIKNQLFKIRKGLVGAKNVGTFARKNQTNCDEFATLEFIPPKYREYNNVFEEFEKSFPRNRFGSTGKIGNRFYLQHKRKKKTKTFSVYIERNLKKSYIRHSISNVNPTRYVCSKKKPGNWKCVLITKE